MIERRRDTRFPALLLTHMKMTLRPGLAVSVIDLAPGGALVHSGRPLRPGSRVHVSIATATHVIRTPAHILRCFVFSIDAAAGAIYAGALRFEERCDLPWEPATRNE